MDNIEVAGLVTKITIDDTGLNKSMAELDRQMKLVQSEFTKASSGLTNFGKSSDGMKAKADSLSKQIDLQGAKVAKLNEKYQQSVAEKGKDAAATQKLETQLNQAVAKYNNLQDELVTTNNELAKQEKAAQVAASGWTKLSTTLDGASKKLESVGKTMSDAGGALTKTITLPLAAIGGLSTKAAIDFETAFAGVRKTVDATEEEFSRLSDGIRQMSTDIPVAATEIAKVAENAGQLGIKKAAILDFTRTMVDLGVSTNLSSDQAATSLARLANITKMPQDQFGRLGATIVALGNNLATTEAEIVEMAMRIAGAGNTVGLTESQIVSFAGALSSVGIEAEAGGTAISKLMINMASAVKTGSKDLIGFAAAAGMTVDQFKESFEKDAAGTIITFIEGLGRMSESGQNVFGVLDALGLSEVRLRDALLRASGAGDLFRESIELGSKAWKENTALTKEAEQRYETTASQLQIFKNRLTDIGITLGDALIPALLKMLDALQPLLNALKGAAEWFANLNPAMQKTIIYTAAFAAALGPTLIVTGKLITATSTVVGALSKMSAAMAAAGGMTNVLAAGARGLGAALTFLVTNPIGLVITALAALTVGFIALNRHMSKDSLPAVRSFGSDAKTALDTATGSFAKFRDGTKSALQDTAKAAKTEGGNIANNIIETIGGGTKKAKDKAIADMRDMVDGMKKEVDRNVSSLNKLGDAITNALKKQYEEMEKVQTKALDDQLAAEQKASDDRIKIYNAEYAEKIKLIDEDAYRQLKSIQDQIDAIDQQTEAEDKAAREQEYLQKVAELQKQIAAAETAEERERIQRDLSKTIADYERRQVLEQRQAQKESLKAQMDSVKEIAAAKKDALKQELEDRKQAESDQLAELKSSLDDQKLAIKAHFDDLTAQESLQAEARKLVIDQNNAEIIRLLESYNPKWQDAGQSFADAFANGLNSQKESMAAAVQSAINIAPVIDRQVEELDRLQAKLSEMEKAASDDTGSGSFGGIANGAESAADAINDQLVPAMDGVGEASEETAERSIDAFLDLRSKAVTELKGLYWSGKQVTEETAAVIADTFFAMGSQIEADLKASHAKQLEETTAFLERSQALTDEEKQQVLEKLRVSMQEQAEVTENGQNRIAEILSAALDEKRGLTNQEYEEITNIQQKMVDEGVKILADGNNRQRVLQEVAKAEAEDMSAQQAAAIVRNSVQQRDEVVAAAQEQFAQTVDAIIQQRDELGTISDEQASKLIQEAKRQRDETVATAEDMHNKIVEQAKLQGAEHYNSVDWETGRILTRWETFRKQTVQYIKDTWHESNESTRIALGNMRDSAKEKLDQMGNAINTGMDNVKSWFSKKWNEIINFLKSINLKDIGSNIMSGLADGLKSAWGNVKDAVSNVTSGIEDQFKFDLKIRSPSRITREIGQFTGEGLAVGMSETIAKIRRQAAALSAAAIPLVGSVAAPGVGSIGPAAVGTPGDVRYDFAGMFSGAVFHVRSEEDVERLAELIAVRIQDKQEQDNRTDGGDAH